MQPPGQFQGGYGDNSFDNEVQPLQRQLEDRF